jgi:negative regulator of flagellin synthesis FlgM
VKIDDSVAGVPSIRTKKTRDKTSAASSTATSGSTSGDNVEFTEASSQLGKLESALSQMDTSEPGKIEAVRQAISDGQFHVDEEAVADALVQTSIEQMKRQGGK